MQQNQQDPAVAAAWAAYYQANPSAAYAANAQRPPAAAAGVQAGPATNVYADYGYGVGAQHAAFNAAQQAQRQQPQAGYAGFQPPLPQQQPGSAGGFQNPVAAGQTQPYRPPAGPQFPQQPQQAPYGQAPAAYGQPGQQGFPAAGGQPSYNVAAPGATPGQPGWAGLPTAGGQMQNMGGGFRPGQQQQQAFFGGGGGGPGQGGPYAGQVRPPHQGGVNAGFRPSPSPTGTPNRPYQPSPVRPPVRPVATLPHGGPGGAFPPAKRPRFDGPGGSGGAGSSGGGGGGSSSSSSNMAMGMAGPSGQGARPNMQINPGMRPALPPGPAAMNGLPVRPNAVGPIRPQGPAAMAVGVPGAPSGPGGGAGAMVAARNGGNVQTAPILREPIRLGLGSPLPAMILRGGGMMGRGGMPHGGGGGRGGRIGAAGAVSVSVPGVSGAPRGPAGVSGIRSRQTPDSSRLPFAPGQAGHRGQHGGSGAAAGAGGAASNVRTGDTDRDRREAAKRKEKEKEKEKENKTTMTDFRIIGIEIGGKVDWSWGIVGEEAKKYSEDAERERRDEEEEQKRKAAEEAAAKEAKNKAKNGPEEGAGEITVKQEPADEVTVKQEPADDGAAAATLSTEAAESDGKRTTKRKASVAEGESEVEGSSKKRAAREAAGVQPAGENGAAGDAGSAGAAEDTSATLAPATDSSGPNAAAAAREATTAEGELPAIPAFPTKFEGNQNRFRIYFESPPELDRVPKAIRRHNKRWRRETSSVAPSGPVGRQAQPDDTVEQEEGHADKANAPAAAAAATATAAAQGAEADKVETGEPAAESTAAAQGEGAATANDAASENVTGQVEVDAAVQEETSEAQAVELAIGAEGRGEEVSSTAAIEGQPASQQVVEPTEERDMADDVSMTTDQGALADLQALQDQVPDLPNEAAPQSDVPMGEAEGVADASVPGSAAEVPSSTAGGVPPLNASTAAVVAENLAKSAEATASAYKSRARRRSSASSDGSHASANRGDAVGAATGDAEDAAGKAHDDAPRPSFNRISVLYEHSSRRLIFDAETIKKIRIFRSEGKIEVTMQRPPADAESDKLPKGVLLEMYDNVDQRFVHTPLPKLAEIWSDQSVDAESVPPLHREYEAQAVTGNGELVMTLWLNLKKPLSEPKWCRANSADEWLFDTFGSRKGLNEAGWRGKLEVVDPDPTPTVQQILEQWTGISSSGTIESRQAFIQSLLADPNDLLEILLRLARGDRNPTLTSPGAPGFGALASAIRPNSPYMTHQTHVSLAVLAMYRLTTDYAIKAGEGDIVRDKIADIIKSLPLGMITRSLDGLYREYTDKR